MPLPLCRWRMRKIITYYIDCDVPAEKLVCRHLSVSQNHKLSFIVCDQKKAELCGMTPEVLEYMVENGLAYSGETIAHLAENKGVPADTLEKIERRKIL